MSRLLFAFLTVFLAACNPNTSSKSDDSSDGLWGKTYSLYTDHESGGYYVFAVQFEKPNKFKSVSGIVTPDLESIIYREYSGIYEKTGDEQYVVTYKYSTCPTEPTETIRLWGDFSKQIFMRPQGSATSFTLDRDTGSVEESPLIAATEDVGCDLVAKSAKEKVLQVVMNPPKTKKRLPANAKKPSSKWMEKVFSKLTK